MITTDILLAKQTLLNDDIIGLPTETVYGLAGNAFSVTAVKKIFELKKRPLFNPLIVHIGSLSYLPKVATIVPINALKLAEAFWPGPLTLLMKKQNRVPSIITAGMDTVAVRMPNHSIALSLLQQIDFPLAAPSANPFGSISPTAAIHVADYFKDYLKIVLDGGECKNGIESTIIGFENNQTIVFRLGAISIEEIENCVGKTILANKENNKPATPGMLLKHYSPRTITILTTDVINTVEKHKNYRIGLLLFSSANEVEIKSANKIAHCEVLSATGNLTEAAKNLYAAMHRLDKLGLDIIIAEQAPEIGLGKSINDRLNRASQN